ncbi:MAG: hypothetical protein P0S94_01715 [Simkaniaceae bacterium]|nr:hypothetical protein [Simkaniaceae bacterium]
MKQLIALFLIVTSCAFSQMYRIFPKGIYDLKTDGHAMIPIKVGDTTMYNRVDIKKTPLATFSKFNIEWDGGHPFTITKFQGVRKGYTIDTLGKSYAPYVKWNSLAYYDVYNEEELYIGNITQISHERYPAMFHIYNAEKENLGIARLNSECDQVDIIDPLEGTCLAKIKKHFYRHENKHASTVKYHWTLTCDEKIDNLLLLTLATHIAEIYWGYGNATDPACFIDAMD